MNNPNQASSCEEKEPVMNRVGYLNDSILSIRQLIHHLADLQDQIGLTAIEVDKTPEPPQASLVEILENGPRTINVFCEEAHNMISQIQEALR